MAEGDVGIISFKQHLKSLMGNCTQHLGDHLQVLREYLLGQKPCCGLLLEIQVNTFAANFRMSLWLRVMSAMPATMRTAIMN